MRPVHMQVNLTNLRANCLQIKKSIAKRECKCKFMAVVKADAYGHGLMPVVEKISKSVNAFGLVELDQAIAMRQAGVDKQIVLLNGIYQPEQMMMALEHRLDLVVHTDWQLQQLEHLPVDAKCHVWLKINSGMNRLGFTLQDADAAVARLSSLPQVKQIVLMTHFASADKRNFSNAPLLRFMNWRSANRLAVKLPCSLGNSAYSLLQGGDFDNFARIGLSLYGASANSQLATANELGLKSVMSLHSQIISLRKLASGDAVGYLGKWKARMPCEIATIALGYGDGLPFAYSAYSTADGNKAAVGLVDGHRCKFVGRISMDMSALMIPTALMRGRKALACGQLVEIFGEKLSIEQAAKRVGLISYDMMCCWLPRVRRVYVN